MSAALLARGLVGFIAPLLCRLVLISAGADTAEGGTDSGTSVSFSVGIVPGQQSRSSSDDDVQQQQKILSRIFKIVPSTVSKYDKEAKSVPSPQKESRTASQTSTNNRTTRGCRAESQTRSAR